MSKQVVRNPLPLRLQSLCAQLRHPGNCVGKIGEQAATAIEAMWYDNRELTACILRAESDIRRTLESSANIDDIGKMRGISAGSSPK